MTHYGMAIDLKRCIACHGCTLACKSVNNLPNDVRYNNVLTDGGQYMDTARGTYPDNWYRKYYPMSCQHCENPACVEVCPVGATYKDPETGVVRQDSDKCIGCRMCMSACPYTGVRSFLWEEPKYALDFPVGDADAPEHVKHTVEKCVFCYGRLAKGETPACMEVCGALARHWGDLDDPDSEISRLVATREYEQLLPEMGTKPSVYYLI